MEIHIIAGKAAKEEQRFGCAVQGKPRARTTLAEFVGEEYGEPDAKLFRK